MESLWFREDDRFEQVMSYYWITTAQRYISHWGLARPTRATTDHSSFA